MPCSLLAGLLPVVLAAVGPAQDAVISAQAGSIAASLVEGTAVASSVAAAEADVEAAIFTEADFLSILDEAHPAMAAGTADLKRARAEAEAAGELADPVLGFAREDLKGPAEHTEWTLSWQLPDADRGFRLEARRHELEALVASVELDRLDLRLRMKESFAEWAFATARFDLLSAQAKRVSALAEREAERARAGEASGLQTRRLRLASDRLRIEAELSAAAAERARSTISAWHPELPIEAVPVLPELPAPPPSDSEHPLLRVATGNLEAARLERQAAGRFIRSPELTLGWLREQADFSSEDGPTVGLTWSVPLFTRQRAKEASAEAEVSARRARLELTRRQVSSARRGHAAAYERLSTAARRALAGLVDVKPMLDATEAAFQLGETSLTDLLETYRSAGESELAYLELYQEALAALWQLERATGTDTHPSTSEKDSP